MASRGNDQGIPSLPEGEAADYDEHGHFIDPLRGIEMDTLTAEQRAQLMKACEARDKRGEERLARGEFGERPEKRTRRTNWSNRRADPNESNKRTLIAFHKESPVSDKRDGHNPSRRWIKWFPYLDHIKRVPGLARTTTCVDYEKMVSAAVTRLESSRSCVFTIDILSFKLSDELRERYATWTVNEIWEDEASLGLAPNTWLKPEFVKGGSGECMRYLSITNTEGVTMVFDMKYLKATFDYTLTKLLTSKRNTFIMYDVPAAEEAWNNLVKENDRSPPFPPTNNIDIQLLAASVIKEESTTRQDLNKRYLDREFGMHKPRDEHILKATRNTVESDRDTTQQQHHLGILEYCAAQCQWHDVLIVIHQRFDNVVTKGTEWDQYWRHLGKAIGSIDMKFSNVDGTVKANNLAVTQDAMEWDEIREVRQIHNEWKRVSQKDQRYDSCFYHYNAVERFTHLPIPQEMTDEQLNEALWKEPTAVHNAYNDWFDHYNPMGCVLMNIDAEKNDSNHQVSIQLYNPGYAQLKTMDYNDEQEFINRIGRNLARNKRITETATGAKRPTPRYRFLATNMKEPIPWNYLIKGENSDNIKLNPEVQKPRYVSAFTEHHRQQFPHSRPTSAMTASIDRKTPLTLVGLMEDQRQQDTGSPSEDQQRPGSSASARGHLDTTRKDSTSSGSRRLPIPSTMTGEEFDAEEIEAKRKRQNYQNRKLLEKQKRELEAVKKQNAEILQQRQQLPPPMKVVTKTSESDGGSSYDTPNSRTPPKRSPATVTQVQEPPTKVNNYRGSSEYVTAALYNIQYDDPEAVKNVQEAVVKRHQRDVMELESKIRLAEENLRFAREHSAQVEAQMAALELSEQDRRNETIRIQRMETDLNERKKANDNRKKEEIATMGGFSVESAAEDKVLEAMDTTLLGEQALHTESAKVTKSARAKLEAEQRNYTATMGDIEQQLHGLRSDLQAARDEVTEAQTDLAKTQSLQEASQQAASTSQLQQPPMTPRQAPLRPVINTAFNKAYDEQCQYNASRPDRQEV